MTFAPGDRIGHYEILSRAGEGGMGVVYLARDLRLDRSIALKVLPHELTQNAEAKARFMQEAKAASSLDHANICTVHDIDETPDGQLFLVMSHYAGGTLKDRIARGPLPLDDALDIASQIAQGLHAAHAAGIVHRDVKPANVMFTADGVVKIVDFGLAKLAGVTAITRMGTTLGTVAYMSPEQTRGDEVDARTDLWSTGVVLYEMVAGRPPFKGDIAAAVVAAIQQQPPEPLTAVRTGVPLALDHVVARALAKDRSERFQTASDLVAELRRLRRDSDSAAPATVTTAAGPPRRAMWMALAGVLVAAALGAALVWPREPAAPDVPRFANPVQVTNAVGIEDYPSWSPDGQTLAYAATQSADRVSGNWDIWIAQVAGGPPVNRTADHPGDDRYPVWSPDGRQIAFWSSREGGGYFVMPALGGAPRKVAAIRAGVLGSGLSQGRPAWSPDGAELAMSVPTASGEVTTMVSPTSGGTRTLAATAEHVGVLDLSWSPSGRHLAFVDGSATADVTRLYLRDLANGSRVPITDGRTNAWSPEWSHDGRALYFVHNAGGAMDLWRQPLDAAGRANGAPVPLTTGLDMRQAVFSRDGRRLAYSKGRRVGNVWRLPIRPDRPSTWADAEQLTFDQAFVEFLDVSPDGARLAVSSDRGGNMDLWTLPAGGGPPSQLTFDPTPDWNPRWSPDGKQVAFYAYRSGQREIWRQPAGGGPAQQVSRGNRLSIYPAWSRDGRRVAFTDGVGERRIIIVSADGGDGRQVAAEGDNANSEWSPDGRWLTFISNRSGSAQVWRMPSGGGPSELVGGGPVYTHRWSPDGTRIYLMGLGERAGTIWEMAPDGTRQRPVTDLRGRRGYLESLSMATDGRYLYFTWGEDLSDIWVMDVY